MIKKERDRERILTLDGAPKAWITEHLLQLVSVDRWIRIIYCTGHQPNPPRRIIYIFFFHAAQQVVFIYVHQCMVGFFQLYFVSVNGGPGSSEFDSINSVHSEAIPAHLNSIQLLKTHVILLNGWVKPVGHCFGGLTQMTLSTPTELLELVTFKTESCF